MRPKVSVYIATSVDGYIARKDDDIGWLDDASSSVPKDEDCGYADLMSTVDVLVLGRRSYEKVLTFGAWPYQDIRVVVLSSQPIDLREDLPESVSWSSDEPQALLERLADEGISHAYIDGGNTIQRFLAAGLVDEMTITMIPILLGEGIPLFGRNEHDIKLKCLGSKHYDFGFVQSKYAVLNEE